jgi:zinc transport system substrate-binding protein
VTSICRIIAIVLLLAAPARGEVPKVVTDIAPVQSLVAMVMQGLGTPGLIIRSNAAPHEAALRPSQARALQAADLVVWVGPGLTPWLGKPLEALAQDAQRLTLLDASETRLLPYRGAAGAQAGADPHAWLDPENGRIWLGLIAERLARTDPDNAALYRANAVAGQAELASLISQTQAMLTPMQGKPYVTYHDAYQYFENRFGLTPVGAVTPNDATPPSPARLARLRAKMQKTDVTCAFIEAAVEPGLLYAAAGQRDLTLITLDPMGRDQDPGPDLYLGMLREMGAAFARCGEAG